tara:strand:- start:1114 stop:1425 length:312 start_codon:yes stop_codon:yes gene_type:complete
MNAAIHTATLTLGIDDVPVVIDGYERLGFLEAEFTVEVIEDGIESAGYMGQPVTPDYTVEIIEEYGSWFGSKCNSEIHDVDSRTIIDNLPHDFDERAIEAALL